jgi:glyoxylase-like metal-dependent hydrolase (beta-lactamase superfamily II)
MEIAECVYRIPCIFFETRIVYCHLLVGELRSILIDTAMSNSPKEDILPYMDSIGFDPARLDYVLITHSDIDHQEGNEAMRAAAPNAIFMCHNLDRPWIESMQALENGRYRQFSADHGIGPAREGNPAEYKINVPMDMTIEGGEVIRLGADWSVELVHTPGHTWGHTGVYDRKHKLFVAGEASLWTTIYDKEAQPGLPPTYCYVDPYIATLERLRGMDIEIYSGAHWPIKQGNDVGTFLDESKNYVLFVEQKLLDTIRNLGRGVGLQELMKILKPALGTWPDSQDFLMAYPLAGNLRRLEDRELIIASRAGNGLVEWSAANVR